MPRGRSARCALPGAGACCARKLLTRGPPPATASARVQIAMYVLFITTLNLSHDSLSRNTFARALKLA